MPQQVRRAHAGWDDEGHHWENAGDVITVSDSQASRLLAQPAVPLYTLVEPGATVEVEQGDPAQADDNSAQAKHERRLATGSTPNDPRLKTPNDNRPEDGSPNTPGSGKADTLASPGATSADEGRGDVPKGKQADLLEGAPGEVDKTTGTSGSRSKVVGTSDSK
jgi:hypothetical protein